MIYRTCSGCLHEKHPCDARDALRRQLKGLSVTSVKWKCKDRTDRFNVGDAVWATTIESTNPDHGEACFDEFPGWVIRNCGSKLLVYIEPGSIGLSEETKFEARSAGFCMIPIFRIKPRDGTPEKICPSCELPESKGHLSGYICTVNAAFMTGCVKSIAGTLAFLIMIFGIAALCTCCAWAADGVAPSNEGNAALTAFVIVGIAAVARCVVGFGQAHRQADTSRKDGWNK